MATITSEKVTDVYEFKKVIGKGGGSYVVLGTHNVSAIDFAIKIFDKKELSADEAIRLQRELDINNQISHSAIVRVVETYESADDVCMVMELMTGGEFFEKVLKDGPMSEELSRSYCLQVLEVISYLHALGIAHRDIKPENLLLESTDPSAPLKLIDFGFAKIAHERSILMTPIGTPNYAAPEVTEKEQYSQAVDLWSVGCLLYFMLFQRPPFYSEDDAETGRLAAVGKYEIPADFELSAEVKDLLSKFLEKDSKKRLSAAQALKHPWFSGAKSVPLSPTPVRSQDADSTTQSSSSSPGAQSSAGHRDLKLSNEEISSLKSELNAVIDTERNANSSPIPTSVKSVQLAAPAESPLALKRRKKALEKEEAKLKVTNLNLGEDVDV